ncbi:alpha/beta hydrolase [Paenibacillus beijingensis]|uniref:alpha/beta hydrolase n=1 Tax=Paenibacillus beijingensis TaxID=1126833 RepID=UPI0006963592|nr:alpha/beta hydrolase [Paenibacillus beijingensis]
MTVVLTVVIIIVLLAAALAYAAFHFFNMAVVRKRQQFLEGDPDLSQPGEGISFDNGWLEQQPLEEVGITTEDGLKLRGYYLPAKAPTRRAVILAHGYTGSAKRDMGSLARLYAETFGYDVLIPDNRSHGQSEGRYIGFGWLDRRDYVQWIDWLISRNGPDTEIVLHGVSMGGAAVLMTAGERLPVNVKGIVSDCAFTSAKHILSYQLKRMFKLPAFPFIDATSLLCRLRAGYFFGEASALKKVKAAVLPILFIHGAADTYVPTEMVHRLYEEYAGYKELFIVPEAGHGMAFRTDQAGYRQAVKHFLNRTL